MTQIDQATSDKMIENMAKLRTELHEFRRIHVSKDVTATSQAGSERDSFSDPEKVKTAFSQGWLLLEVADDQVESFIRSVANPALPFAASTSVRAILESSALATWLVDTDITVQDRVKRSFAFRYEGIEQERKWLNSIGETTKATEKATRIENIELEAVALGFTKLEDGKGRRTGIGQVMPSATDIIKSMFDEEKTYRVLSGVVHGHFWALQGLGLNTDSLNSTVQKHLSPKILEYLCIMTATIFTKAIWKATQFFDWDETQLKTILESDTYSSIFFGKFIHWK
jgi:hypothetical protein